MKKFIIKVFMMAVIISATTLIVKLSIDNVKQLTSAITYFFLFITLAFKSVKKPKSDFSFLKTLCFLMTLFFPFYLVNIHWLTIPSILVLFYTDVIGSRKTFINKIYEKERKRRLRKSKLERKKRENEEFHRQLRNLYHEKDGRRLYITDI